MLVKYETKKLLTFSILLLIILAFIIQLTTVRSSATSIDTRLQSEQYYMEYLKQFEGKLTNDKEEKICELKEFFDDTLSNAEVKKQAYINNEITKEEYDLFLEDLTYCRQRNESFNRLYDDYTYIKTAMLEYPSGPEPEFLYKGYWEKLFSPYSFNFVLGLLIMILVVKLVISEYSSEMIPLLHSSMKGRIDTLYAKLFSGGILISVLSLLFALTELLIYYNISYLPNKDASIQSLEYFTGFSINISLGTLSIIGVVGKVVAGVFISQAFILIGYLIKKRNGLIAIMLIVLFVPLFISIVSPDIYAFSPASLFNFYNIIRYAAENHILLIQFVIPICIYGLYAGIIWLLAKKVKASLLLKNDKYNLYHTKH